MREMMAAPVAVATRVGNARDTVQGVTVKGSVGGLINVRAGALGIGISVEEFAPKRRLVKQVRGMAHVFLGHLQFGHEGRFRQGAD